METEILDSLKNAQTVQEVEQIIEKYLPGWLIVSLDGYSEDYPHFTKNWNYICREMKSEPQKIVLVREIDFPETPTLVNKFCEFMTSRGYVVRRSSEFIPCPVCEKAIPCEEIWTLLKEKGMQVPRVWDNRCIGCKD